MVDGIEDLQIFFASKSVLYERKLPHFEALICFIPRGGRTPSKCYKTRRASHQRGITTDGVDPLPCARDAQRT